MKVEDLGVTGRVQDKFAQKKKKKNHPCKTSFRKEKTSFK